MHTLNGSLSSPATLITKSPNFDVDLITQTSSPRNPNQQNSATSSNHYSNRGKKNQRNFGCQTSGTARLSKFSITFSNTKPERPNIISPMESLVVCVRLNCSFNPLTFTKLRFWPPKKNYKTTP